MRVPKTATVVIAIMTAAVLAADGACLARRAARPSFMGVIPARLSGLIEISPAVPVWLTPLSSRPWSMAGFSTSRSTC